MSASSRSTVIRVQTLTKSEYHLHKNIPEAVPKKKHVPEKNTVENHISPTPLSFDSFSSIKYILKHI